MMSGPDDIRLSFRENVAFLVLVILPIALRGAIVERRRWSWFVARLPNALGNRFLERLRNRHDGARAFRGFLIRGMRRVDTLIVLDQGRAAETLRDGANHDTARTTRRLFSRFAPTTLITLANEQHQCMRQFHVETLCGKTPPQNARYAVAAGRVDTALAPLLTVSELRHRDFRTFARRASCDIVLGELNEDFDYAKVVGRMIRRATALPGGTSIKYRSFHANLERELGRTRAPGTPEGGLARCSASDLDPAALARQVTHWLFALKDTLDTHVPRTLALIVSHEEVYRRVRAETSGAKLDDLACVHALTLVERCVLETLRLWTATPVLFRQAPGSGEGQGGPEEVLLPLSFLHRDPSVIGDTHDRFDPDRSDTTSPSTFQFGLGPRDCAGRPLALFVAKLAVARLLGSSELVLFGPSVFHRGGIRDVFNTFEVGFRRR